MGEKSTIVRHSLGEISVLREISQDQTTAHAPEAASLGMEFWQSARAAMPAAATSSPSVRSDPKSLKK